MGIGLVLDNVASEADEEDASGVVVLASSEGDWDEDDDDIGVADDGRRAKASTANWTLAGIMADASLCETAESFSPSTSPSPVSPFEFSSAKFSLLDILYE